MPPQPRPLFAQTTLSGGRDRRLGPATETPVKSPNICDVSSFVKMIYMPPFFPKAPSEMSALVENPQIPSVRGPQSAALAALLDPRALPFCQDLQATSVLLVTL